MRSSKSYLSALAVASLAVALAGLPASAQTAEWRMVPSESRIVFEYRSDGQPARGILEDFSGQGSFRPEAPAEATFELTIQTESIDLGDARANAFATSAEWFDSRNYPNIVYELQDLTHLDGNSYRAIGDLSIRGKTKPVTTTITLEIDQREARASGTLTVNRKDFGLGVGPMSLFVDIGPEVSVHFELTAHPAR